MKHPTSTITKKMMVECLACNDDIFVEGHPQIGRFVICDSCDAEFIIIDLKPTLIDWPDFDDYCDEEEGYYDDIDDEDDY